MRTTISVIKADIGSIGGHSTPSKEIIEEVRNFVSQSYLITDFKIHSFHFSGYAFSGFEIPAADLNQLFSALIASFFIGFISTALHWVFH